VPQPLSYETESGLDPAFLEGVERFEAGDVAGAAPVFEQVVQGAKTLDRHYAKYLSYYGAALALSGDARGLAHCRTAAQADSKDADILYHLARAELRFGHRRQAILAIEAGLKAEGAHERLTRLRSTIGMRRLPVLSFLGRDNVLNRILGKLTCRKRRAVQFKGR
jgi:hypothetical protein